MSRHNSKHKQRTTYAGRIVYDRKPHKFGWNDAIRILKTLNVDDLSLEQLLPVVELFIVYTQQIIFQAIIRAIDPYVVILLARDLAYNLIKMIYNFSVSYRISAFNVLSGIWNLIEGLFRDQGK